MKSCLMRFRHLSGCYFKENRDGKPHTRSRYYIVATYTKEPFDTGFSTYMDSSTLKVSLFIFSLKKHRRSFCHHLACNLSLIYRCFKKLSNLV